MPKAKTIKQRNIRYKISQKMKCLSIKMVFNDLTLNNKLHSEANL